MFVGRIDNLCSSYSCLRALIDSCPSEDSLVEETGIRSVALFDNEEIGSESAQGAGGPIMRDTITRVADYFSGEQHFYFFIYLILYIVIIKKIDLYRESEWCCCKMS